MSAPLWGLGLGAPRLTLRALFWLLFSVLASFICLSILSFWSEESDQPQLSLSIVKKSVAVIYAGPTFHEEVVSSVACLLKDLDFHTVVYIGNGLHIAGMMVPLSGRRKRSSRQFYGHCVSQWVTKVPSADPSPRYPHDPDLLVFITYPMHTKGFVKDGAAFDLLRHHKQTQAHTSVVLVTHRVGEMLHPLLRDIEGFVDRRQLFFLYLGEHTRNSGLRAMAEAGRAARSLDVSGQLAPQASTTAAATTAASASLSSDQSANASRPYTLAYLYPIIPLYYITALSPLSVPWTDHLLSLLDRLGGAYTGGSSATSSVRGSAAGSPSGPAGAGAAPAAAGVIFGIQGNMGGKHAHRKDVKGAVRCLRDIEAGQAGNSNSTASTSTSPATTAAASADATSVGLGLDLVGHISQPFETGSLLRGDIRLFSDLPSSLYYQHIAQLTFMVPSLLDRDYTSTQATSSVPAALIAGTPLVASRDFLSIYPCLRDKEMHRRVALNTECESVRAAAGLPAEAVAEMRREMRACSDVLYKEGMGVLAAIADAAKQSRVRQRIAAERA